MNSLQEYFTNQLNHKLLILCGLLVIGAVIAILRRISAASSSIANEKMITNFNRNPTLADEFARSIDTPYRTIQGVTTEEFQALVVTIIGRKYLDEWLIDYAQLVAKDEFLIITTIGFESFGTSLTGQPDNINSKNHHDFVIRHNYQKSQLIILSSLHTNSDEKFQKESFAKIIESQPTLP